MAVRVVIILPHSSISLLTKGRSIGATLSDTVGLFWGCGVRLDDTSEAL